MAMRWIRTVTRPVESASYRFYVATAASGSIASAGHCPKLVVCVRLLMPRGGTATDEMRAGRTTSDKQAGKDRRTKPVEDIDAITCAMKDLRRAPLRLVSIE